MSAEPPAAGPRIRWADVPDAVRAGVERSLGSPVEATASQVGGFSPGSADRAVLSDGRRVFVKAVGVALNPDSPGLHRAEIAALGLLPAGLPRPRLLASYDDGDWVALVTDDVEGRTAALPWHDDDLDAVLLALGALPVSGAAAELPTFHDHFAASLFGTWSALAAGPPAARAEVASRHPWALAHLDLLVGREAAAGQFVVGDALVHADVRADNVLLRPDGGAVLVDWAWACRGAGWIDEALLVESVLTQGGPDAGAVLARCPRLRAASPELLEVFLSCVAGVFVDRSARPAPPGLPTIRAWQDHCARATLSWLEQRASGSPISP